MNTSKILSLVRMLDSIPFLEMLLLVMGVVLAIACLVMLFLHFFRKSNLDSVQGFGYIGNDIIASVFGLLLAFLIISMYEGNKNADKSVNKEANDLVCILLASQRLDNAAQIRKEVKMYVKILLEKQWPAMTLGELETAWKLEPEMINPLYKVVQESKPISGGQEKFYKTLPGLLEDLTNVHRLRLLEADFHLPVEFWVIIFMMSFITICFLAYMNPWQGLHSLAPVLLPTIIISLSLSLIISLHFPFLGPFAVDNTPFHSGYLDFSKDYNALDILPRSFNDLDQSKEQKTDDSTPNTLI